MSVSPRSLDKQVGAAAVRVTGKRWCASCFAYHDAETMKAFRTPAGGAIYRCQKWIAARAMRKVAACNF